MGLASETDGVFRKPSLPQRNRRRGRLGFPVEMKPIISGRRSSGWSNRTTRTARAAVRQSDCPSEIGWQPLDPRRPGGRLNSRSNWTAPSRSASRPRQRVTRSATAVQPTNSANSLGTSIPPCLPASLPHGPVVQSSTRVSKVKFSDWLNARDRRIVRYPARVSRCMWSVHHVVASLPDQPAPCKKQPPRSPRCPLQSSRAPTPLQTADRVRISLGRHC